MEKRFKNKCWDFSVVENGVSAKQSRLAKLKIVHIGWHPANARDFREFDK